ncbi:hypothetical protein, partial [Brevibacillus invocatus]|uniref:hypothetical protein n=1 Tax=Brevibacillus invocatus TaxID=173959 RepID=UPI001C82C490
DFIQNTSTNHKRIFYATLVIILTMFHSEHFSLTRAFETEGISNIKRDYTQKWRSFSIVKPISKEWRLSL